MLYQNMAINRRSFFKKLDLAYLVLHVASLYGPSLEDLSNLNLNCLDSLPKYGDQWNKFFQEAGPSLHGPTLLACMDLA